MFSSYRDLVSPNEPKEKSLPRLKEALASADCILIGAGAGLSTAAGYTYGGERFRRYFADFEEKYGFHDMYSGGFYPYRTQEEFWAFWSRSILANRYEPIPTPLYEELLSLVSGKDYFVLTTNVDHCFQRAGFDKKRLFYTQGDYGLFQCSVPCHARTYDNEERVRQMVKEQKDGAIPTALIPKCPRCGRPMTTNLRIDDRFVEDGGWQDAAGRYADFVRTRRGQRMLLLELGVGYNTPGIIKFPFWQIAGENPKATYACVNSEESSCPRGIADRAILIRGDIAEVVSKLK